MDGDGCLKKEGNVECAAINDLEPDEKSGPALNAVARRSG